MLLSNQINSGRDTPYKPIKIGQSVSTVVKEDVIGNIALVCTHGQLCGTVEAVWACVGVCSTV